MIGHADNPAPGDRQAMAMMPAFLDAGQKSRLAAIRRGQLLHSGRWRDYLLGDARTAHLYKAIRNAAGVERALLVTVNVLGLAAKKTADLLMLDPPTISVDDRYPLQAEAVGRIAQASHLDAVLYEGALTACYEAEAWLQVLRVDNRVCVVNRPAEQCFPVGEQRADGTYPAVERMWLEPMPAEPGPGSRRRLLRKEIHERGLIHNQAFALDGRGRIESAISLPGVPEQVETGVDEPLLDFVANFSVSGRSVSDFEGVDELVDQFTASLSQAAGVIARHADPKIGLPASMADEQGKVSAADDAFYVQTKDEMPTYLTWNAQLESAERYTDRWLDWLLVIIEMSPSLLGLRKGAAPDAFKKLRLEAVNTLAKVGRKKLYWTPFLRDTIRRANKLEQVSGFRYDFADVSVDWHDGIPLDESEQAEDVGARKDRGLIDRRSAVEELYPANRAALINERLDAEQAVQRAVTMNLGEGPAIQIADQPAVGQEGVA